MKAFEYVNPRDLQQASQLLAPGRDKVKLLAGGVDLLTEMQERIIEPDKVVNLKAVRGLDQIRIDNRGLTLGPLVTLAAIAGDARIRRNYNALAEAAESVGSPQIRNVGTIGGNLCQRPRCWYYRDEGIKCLKKGGTMCYAAQADGANKYNAILAGGPSFIVHPSDCATALVALGAIIRYGTGGRPKEIAAEDFFTLPARNATRENVLTDTEILQEIFVPAPKSGSRTTYIKFREKDSMDFALSAVAIAAVVSGETIQDCRVVLGGVAPKPWRSKEAEGVLNGKRYTRQLANEAAEKALADASPLSKNAYKVPLTKVLIRRAIEWAATGKSAVTPIV